MHDFLPKPAVHDIWKKPAPLRANGEDLSSSALPVFRKASCACGGGCPSCTGREGLKVSHPNDAAEIEADRVADTVIRMPGGGSVGTSSHAGETKPAIQRKSTAGGGGAPVGDEITGRINASRGGGTGLDGSTRGFMESRFGASFGDVRIHTGNEAARLSRDLGAHAFTLGNDIYFGEGQYRPETGSGRHILAHELAHVTQQGDTIHRYRDKPEKNPNSINFGVAGEKDFQEDSFDVAKDKETKPWIEEIVVNLAPGKIDVDGHPYWTGTAVAKYYKEKMPDYHFPVSAGSLKLGMATESKEKEGGKAGERERYTINRIEGPGYMSGKYSGRYPRVSEKGYGRKYTTDLKTANMHWALFYYKNEALHGGPRDASSHGCIHVDLYDIRHVNYHSVKDLTKVQVNYFNENPGKWMLNKFEDFVEIGAAARPAP